jgi:hypothetical protein
MSCVSAAVAPCRPLSPARVRPPCPPPSACRRAPLALLALVRQVHQVAGLVTRHLPTLPLAGRDHYSFLIIENAMLSKPTKVYHVNSMRKAHDSGYAHDVLRWFLTEVQKEERSGSQVELDWTTFVHYTKPQQTNVTDSGLYVLHYMEKIPSAYLRTSQSRSRR